MTSEKIVIGILGATGNLGSSFLSEFQKSSMLAEVEIATIGRPGKLSADFNITKSGLIQSERGKFPTLIVNLSNYYTPHPNHDQDIVMRETIIGVAGTISNTIRESNCSVISASTYFQYCPDVFKPWSHYAEIKAEAKKIIEDSAMEYGTNFSDFVLYDNFGGLNRNKFVDLLISSLQSGNQIDCTRGEQVLNLTHVSDLARAFIAEVERVTNSKSKGIHTYDLKSNFTVNLRELVLIAEEASGRQATVNWGAIEYRAREVFDLWETGFNPPYNWQIFNNFGTFIKEKFSLESRNVEYE